MKTIIIASLAITFALPLGLRANPAEEPLPPGYVDLLIPQVEIEETHLVNINTGEKTRLTDGSYNNRYVHRRPSEGMSLLAVRMHLATEEGKSARFGPYDVRVTRSGEKSTHYFPLAWFVDNDWTYTALGPMTVDGKALVEFAVEVPSEGRNDLVLHIGEREVGTIGELRSGPETADVQESNE
jgi:hypothetical protein